MIKHYIALFLLVAPDNPYTKDECDFPLHATDTIMYIVLLVRQTIGHLTIHKFLNLWMVVGVFVIVSQRGISISTWHKD